LPALGSSYCFHVQARMIDATGQRKRLGDIKDVFQALQCGRKK
jgi:hypothetical protein